MKKTKKQNAVTRSLPRETEAGAAQINISLSRGKIIVRHTYPEGPVLYKKFAFKGDWDKIWKAIRG